jgi:hypothetical protein
MASIDFVVVVVVFPAFYMTQLGFQGSFDAHSPLGVFCNGSTPCVGLSCEVW